MKILIVEDVATDRLMLRRDTAPRARIPDGRKRSGGLGGCSVFINPNWSSAIGVCRAWMELSSVLEFEPVNGRPRDAVHRSSPA
jgi:hypothetical protein